MSIYIINIYIYIYNYIYDYNYTYIIIYKDFPPLFEELRSALRLAFTAVVLGQETQRLSDALQKIWPSLERSDEKDLVDDWDDWDVREKGPRVRGLD